MITKKKSFNYIAAACGIILIVWFFASIGLRGKRDKVWLPVGVNITSTTYIVPTDGPYEIFGKFIEEVGTEDSISLATGPIISSEGHKCWIPKDTTLTYNGFSPEFGYLVTVLDNGKADIDKSIDLLLAGNPICKDGEHIFVSQFVYGYFSDIYANSLQSEQKAKELGHARDQILKAIE